MRHDEAEIILAYLEARASGRPITQICKEHGVSMTDVTWWFRRMNSQISATKQLRGHFMVLRYQLEAQKSLLRRFATPSKN